MPQAMTFGFNGATAIEPWNPPRSGSWIWRPSTRFNGATAIEPWNRVTVDGVVRTNLTLQWGHGN